MSNDEVFALVTNNLEEVKECLNEMYQASDPAQYAQKIDTLLATGEQNAGNLDEKILSAEQKAVIEQYENDIQALMLAIEIKMQ